MCPGDDDRTEGCSTDAGCSEGRVTLNGVDTGVCDVDSGYCRVKTWCPLDRVVAAGGGNGTRMMELSGVENFTIFIRVNVFFPAWDKRTGNVRKSDTAATEGRNLFLLRDLLQRASVPADRSTLQRGAVLRVRFTVNCDCDRPMDECTPGLEVFRVDHAGNEVSYGYNYREHVFLNNTATRLLRKKTGVLVEVQLAGRGRRFSIIALLTKVGAGLALLGVSRVLCDAVIMYVHKYKEYYTHYKFFVVDDADARVRRGGRRQQRRPERDARGGGGRRGVVRARTVVQ